MSLVRRILTHLDGFGRRRRFQIMGGLALFLNWFVLVVWNPPGRIMASMALVDGFLLIVFGGMLARHARMMFATAHAHVVPRFKLPILATLAVMATSAAGLVSIFRFIAGDPALLAFGATFFRLIAGMIAGWQRRAWIAAVGLAVLATGPHVAGVWTNTLGRDLGSGPITGLVLGAFAVTGGAWLLRAMQSPIEPQDMNRKRRTLRWRLGRRWLGIGRDELLDRLRSARSPRAAWSMH